jgi:excisionase family DNA binding protein
MNAPETVVAPPDEHEADLAKSAQRILVAALDHSRAHHIKLVDESGDGSAPVIELPPQALRLLAEILGMLGQRQPVMIVPQKHELSTQEAAAFLNVSRPFVVKEIEQGRLKHRKVGRHRRVAFEELIRYQSAQREQTEKALQGLATQAQELGLGY